MTVRDSAHTEHHIVRLADTHLPSHDQRNDASTWVRFCRGLGFALAIFMLIGMCFWRRSNKDDMTV